MGEPIGKTPINGVLSCWFDDEPGQDEPTPVDVQPTYPHPHPHPQVATPAPQTYPSPQPVAQASQPQAFSSQPAMTSPAVATMAKAAPPAPYDGQQAMSSLLNLMEAIHDKHMLPELMVPAGGRHEAPLMRPDNDAKPTPQAIPQPSAPTYRPSFQELICRIYQSAESRSYQWLQMQGLAIEFDQRAVSLEQRWNTDGSFCAVRRTANGYSHTVMLKADGSCAGERITGPAGPIAQFNSTGNVVTSELSNSFARQIA